MAWQELKDKLLYEKANLGRIKQMRILWSCGAALELSMDEHLYHAASVRDILGIRSLKIIGAGLEWRDENGQTPLILVCQRQDRFDVAKVLIDLGANVNAIQPGRNQTPLHHAIMKGLDKTVKLLLANGANPFVRNIDDHSALDLARKKGRFTIVRMLETHMSIFSGWLRVERGFELNGVLRPIISDFRPWRVCWAMVLPNYLTRPLRLELVMYLAHEVKPCEVIRLMGAHINIPNFNKPDPSMVLEFAGKRYKFFSECLGEKEQIKLFYNACQGVPQETYRYYITPPQVSAPYRAVSRSTHSANSFPAPPPLPRTIPAPTPLTNSATSPGMDRSYTTDLGDIELTMAINASIETAIAEGSYVDPHLIPEISTTGTSLSFNEPLASNTTSDEIFYDACSDQVITNNFSDVTAESSSHDLEGREAQESDLCIICLDARAEAACVPCGHMAGCLACFKKLLVRSRQCPVCRARIDQVIKIYSV